MNQTTPGFDANAAFEKITNYLKMPPLRKTADLDAFKAMYTEFYNDLGPSGFMSDLIVYRIALDTWHMFELMRDRNLLVERRGREQRIRAADQEKKRQIKLGKEYIDEEFGYTDTSERQNAIKELYKDADKAHYEETHTSVQDVDYAVVIEGYEYLDKIDRLLDRHSGRISDLLRELAWCDGNLAKKARAASDRIIEGTIAVRQLKSTEAPLLPSDPIEAADGQSSPPA